MPPYARKTDLLVFLGLFMSLMCLVGCGSQSGPPIAGHGVSGEVTFRGKPLAWGTISFEPMGEADPMSLRSAEILDGKYEIPPSRGLSAGTYRVRITGGMDPADNPALGGGPVEGDANALKDRVPAQYNEKSTLTAQVKAEGPNQFTYRLN
jgi:hypothetical protein